MLPLIWLAELSKTATLLVRRRIPFPLLLWMVACPALVDDYVRGPGHHQLAGSRDAPGVPPARVIRQARDGCRDFVRKRVGGTWVPLSDILDLLFEIAFRGAQPDDPHRPRSGLAFLLNWAPRAFHFRTTSS